MCRLALKVAALTAAAILQPTFAPPPPPPPPPPTHTHTHTHTACLLTACGDSCCPSLLDPTDGGDNGFDSVKNQCCQYFRSGCCSPDENRTLLLL